MPNLQTVHVLGTAQDGGYPQVGCVKECCLSVWKNSENQRFPSCIALINQSTKKYWLFDVTPDVKFQIKMLEAYDCTLAGVFITHAHIGHYMGLINFGLEVMNLSQLPIYVMHQMKSFLENNSIIDQMIQNKNIDLIEIKNQEFLIIDDIRVKPFTVPHRNELSETVGFQIYGESKKVVYLPDIDSWDGELNNLIRLIKSNDILFIDGTFYSRNELVARDISKIPHPAITETMQLLSELDQEEKKKVHFIHFNHTNDVLRDGSEAMKNVIDEGFLLSREMQTFQIS